MDYQLLQGDNRAVLDAKAAKSIHAIITSPPYFGLRAYSGDQQVEWPTVEYAPMPGLPSLRIQGCEPGCKHEWGEAVAAAKPGQVEQTKWKKAEASGKGQTAERGAYCQLCGGWRGGLGNEPTLEAYIGHLILCLRSWHRVLRDDGCCFVNLGDSYYNYRPGSGQSLSKQTLSKTKRDLPDVCARCGNKLDGLKEKDLCLVPARFALAAQADGWYVRSRIIWAKGVSFLPDYAGSCMPESVQDRPTKSDEDIYLLTKQPNYFWDNEAVKEKALQPIGKQVLTGQIKSGQLQSLAASTLGTNQGASSRSLRSVWVINPQGYDGAHFAVWPEKLVAPMIKAATSEYGCCAQCGAPYERVVESESSGAAFGNVDGRIGLLRNDLAKHAGRIGEKKSTTTGWQPTCTCAADVIPCTVLDPFNGSGTTGAVACAHNRNYIGIDLSADYIELAHVRIREAINESGRAYIAPVCKTTDFVDLTLFGG